MQTDNTTAVQTAIDLACVFASPLLNSGQQRLGQVAIDVSLTVFSRMVLTDDADNLTKIQALKSYLSNSNSVGHYEQEFCNFLGFNNFDNLRTLISENIGNWPEIEKILPLIFVQWAESTTKWGVKLLKDMVSTHQTFKKNSLYALLENPPQDFYETFFYNKAVQAVVTSNAIIQTAQRMNQELLNDIAANKFLSVAEVQAKIQERRNVVSGSAPAHGFPPGPE